MATTTLRSRQEVEEHLADLEREIASSARHEASGGHEADTWKERLDGHRATYRWLLGDAPSPFTGKTKDPRSGWEIGSPPPPLMLIFERKSVLDDLFPGHRVEPIRASGRHQSWLHAVELTIDWALGYDDRDPLTAL